MIKVTRLNNVPLTLNSDLIEHIDATPDTLIALVSGQKYMVRESPEEVVDRVVAFRQSLLRGQRPQSVVVPAGLSFSRLAIEEKSVNG